MPEKVNIWLMQLCEQGGAGFPGERVEGLMGISQKLWLTGALGGPAKHLLSGDISRSAGLRLPAFLPLCCGSRGLAGSPVSEITALQEACKK